MFTYMCLLKSWFFDLQKNRSQKLSMIEEKQGQFWNLHQIPHKTSSPDFRLIFLMMEDFQIKLQLIFLVQKKTEKTRKSGFEVLLGIRCRFQNCLSFSSSIDGF